MCENVHEGCVCCCRLSNRVVEDLQLCKGIVYRYCWDAISLSPVVIAHCRYYAFCAFYYCCEISGRFSSSNFFWGDTLSYGTSIGTLSAGGSSVSFPPVHLDIRSSHERALSSELDAGLSRSCCCCNLGSRVFMIAFKSTFFVLRFVVVDKYWNRSSFVHTFLLDGKMLVTEGTST